jgi:hypothetical protein
MQYKTETEIIKSANSDSRGRSSLSAILTMSPWYSTDYGTILLTDICNKVKGYFSVSKILQARQRFAISVIHLNRCQNRNFVRNDF